MLVQAFPQLVLNGNVAGLIGGELNQQQIELIDGTAVVNDQLHALVTPINPSPHQEAGFSHQVICEARVTLGKHHRFATSGEILKLQDRHAIALTGGDLAHFSHHRNGTHLGFVGLFLQGTQTDGGQQLRRGCELFEWVIGEVEAHQIFFETKLFGWGIVRHRRRLGCMAEIRRPIGIGGRSHQIKEVALAAVSVFGP